MNDVTEFDNQWNPRLAVPDFQTFLNHAAERSLAVRKQLHCNLDVRYGDGPLQTLDVFRGAGKDLPVYVFIHGGFWRGLDKGIYSEIAAPAVASGAVSILVNYDLCPKVTVDDIVCQIRACVAWIYGHVSSYGGNPDQITLCGHSAGAHLAAAAICHDWAGNNLPVDIIKAVTLISGIYDLTIVPRLSVNEEIRLTHEMACRNSVMFLDPTVFCKVLVAVGGDEQSPWIQQSLDYAEKLERNGLSTEYMELTGEHHFSVADGLANPEHALTKACLRLVHGR